MYEKEHTHYISIGEDLQNQHDYRHEVEEVPDQLEDIHWLLSSTCNYIFNILSYHHHLLNYICNEEIGWVSGVAFSSYFHIFIVLSHSPLNSLVPLRSNYNANIPFSAAMDPGWGLPTSSWKLYPEDQSQNFIVPSSPPVTNTPSWLTAIESMIELWPDIFLMN